MNFPLAEYYTYSLWWFSSGVAHLQRTITFSGIQVCCPVKQQLCYWYPSIDVCGRRLYLMMFYLTLLQSHASCTYLPKQQHPSKIAS